MTGALTGGALSYEAFAAIYISNGVSFFYDATFDAGFEGKPSFFTKGVNLYAITGAVAAACKFYSNGLAASLPGAGLETGASGLTKDIVALMFDAAVGLGLGCTGAAALAEIFCSKGLAASFFGPAEVVGTTGFYMAPSSITLEL